MTEQSGENEEWHDVWERAHNSFAMLSNECNRVANALNMEGAFEWTEGLQPIIDQIATERAAAEALAVALEVLSKRGGTEIDTKAVATQALAAYRASHQPAAGAQG